MGGEGEGGDCPAFSLMLIIFCLPLIVCGPGVPPRNENPESQALHLKKKKKGRVNDRKKQCRCHYHIISVQSIMNEMHIKQAEAGVYENDLCD